VRRHRIHPAVRGTALVVTISLLGLALGYAGATRLDSHDLGRSTLLLAVAGQRFLTRNGDTAVDLKTDGQVALSDAVLSPVATAFHNGLTVETLRSRLNVKLVDNAEVVIITYKGGGAAHAVDVVKRVAEQLMNVRTARAKVAYKEQAAIITPELKAAEDRAAEAVKGAGEGKDQNGEAQTILNQRVVSLRTELRGPGTPARPGTVLDHSAASGRRASCSWPSLRPAGCSRRPWVCCSRQKARRGARLAGARPLVTRRSPERSGRRSAVWRVDDIGRQPR
jgi:hypothetical protein